MTVRDLLRALLLASANDAAVALAVGPLGLHGGVRRGDERPRPRARAEGHELREPGRARRPGQPLVGARPRRADAGPAAQALLPRDGRPARRRPAQRLAPADDREPQHARAGGAVSSTASRRGARQQAGYVLVGSATRDGVTVISAVLGEPTEAARNADTLALLRYGLVALRAPDGAEGGRRACGPPTSSTATTRSGSSRGRRSSASCARGQQARTRVVERAGGARRAAARPAPRSARSRCASGGKVVERVPLVTATAVAEASLGDRVRLRPLRAGLDPPRRAARRLYCAAGASPAARRPEGRGSPMIITVTLNAAIDKTLSVPNFRLGRRHRTVDQTTMAGGKGVNVARALKALGPAGDRDGPAGRPDRHADRRAADRRSRSSTTSSASARSRARTRRSSTRRPASRPRSTSAGRRSRAKELELFGDKLVYLARGAEIVVLAGSLPRGVETDAYARPDPRAAAASTSR